MKIEVFAICYNESVLLPYFIRHYLTIAEKITIYDNFSTDNTLEICKQYPQVEVIQYDSGNQIRDDIYLQIKNNCWKNSKADWVIVCDIDEILWGVNLVNLDEYTIVMPDWWEMTGEKLPTTNGQIYDEIKHGVCHGQTSKCLMFKPGCLSEINYTPGAHGINTIGDARVLHTPIAKILHYKYISLQYVIDRHQAFKARLSNINRENKWGVQYDHTIDQITEQYNALQSFKALAV